MMKVKTRVRPGSPLTPPIQDEDLRQSIKDGFQQIFDHHKAFIPSLKEIPLLSEKELDKVFDHCFWVGGRVLTGLSPEDRLTVMRARQILKDFNLD